MPSEKNLRSIFSDIATEIREKLKNTDVIKPYNMADKIKEISSGVNFQILESYPTDFSLLDSKKCYTGFDKGKEFYVVFDEATLIPLDSFFTALTGTTMPTPIFKVDTENDIPTSTMGVYYTNALDNMYLVIDGHKEVLAPISTTIEPNTVFAVDANVNRWILRYETYFGEKFKQFEFYAPKSNGPSIRMTSMLSLDICNTLGINNKIYPIVVSFESISQDELSDKKYPNDVIYMYVNFNNQNGKVFLKTNNTVSIGIDDLSSSIFVNEAMYKYTEEDITTSINNGEQFFAVTNINEADSAYGWNTYQYKDKNITPENIKFGVNINGVTGTLPKPQGRIEIRDTEETNVTWYETAQIVDSNLVAENIAKDVTILGVTGKLSRPNGKKEITNTEEVDVSNYATAQVVDVNLVPENIAKGKRILGVIGTLESSSGTSITENIKITGNKNDILGTTEHNKLCILSETGDLSFKVVNKIDDGSKEISTLSEVLPQALNSACCARYKDDIYIFGGNNGSTYLDTIYRFNCTNKTITALSITLPQKLYYACCSICNDNIYIFGGYSPSLGTLNTIYKFNCTTERITELSTKIPASLECACCSIHHNNIYIFGGTNTRPVNTIYKFDCEKETIIELSIGLPQPLSYSTCMTYKDNIYIFGGYNDKSNVNTIYKFNCNTKETSVLNTVLPEILRNACCSIKDDNIYIFYGSSIYKFNANNEEISEVNVTLDGELNITKACCSSYENTIYVFSNLKVYTLLFSPDLSIKNLPIKIVDKIVGGYDELLTLSEVLPDATAYAFCARYKDNIYIFGGANNSSTNKNNRTNIIYKFNCKTKTIETLSTRLPQILTEACCSTYNDNIYIFGGTSTSVQRTIYKFNCKTETIETLSVTLPAMRYGACCATYGDNIYIFGGNTGTYVCNTIFKFNCKTETISILSTKLPTNLYYICCSTYNDNIYIFGGFSTSVQKTIYKFNCQNETISTLSVTLPVPLYAPSCSIFNDVIYILGGNNGNGAVNTIYTFNCKTETIETLSVTLPQPVSLSFCCSIYENNIYLFGGHSDSKRLNTIYNLFISFELTANNVLIYNANSNYSFELITDQVTIPIKNIYIGNSNNRAEFAKAYLYDEKQSAWVNINTDEVLT